jgi:hypothetical protein
MENSNSEEIQDTTISNMETMETMDTTENMIHSIQENKQESDHENEHDHETDIVTSTDANTDVNTDANTDVNTDANTDANTDMNTGITSIDSIQINEHTENENENKPKSKPKSKSKPKPKSKQSNLQAKPKFENTCSHCLKLFKNIKLYDKHINEQLCYKDNEITYCKICLITYTNRQDYKNHLFSLDHINNIGFNSIEKIIKPSSSIINTLDPYLNKNDIHTLTSNNLGDNFTFVYEKGNTQTIILKPKTNITTITTSDPSTKTITNTTITINNNNDGESSGENSSGGSGGSGGSGSGSGGSGGSGSGSIIITEPTIRQTKIINFLEKQVNKNSIIDSGNCFYKMLDNKLQLEDYKGLQNIIKNLNINEDYKLNYLNTVDIFISFLVKETTIGNNTYKDKDISQLVINLTT